MRPASTSMAVCCLSVNSSARQHPGRRTVAPTKRPTSRLTAARWRRKKVVGRLDGRHTRATIKNWLRMSELLGRINVTHSVERHRTEVEREHSFSLGLHARRRRYRVIGLDHWHARLQYMARLRHFHAIQCVLPGGPQVTEGVIYD